MLNYALKILPALVFLLILSGSAEAIKVGTVDSNKVLQEYPAAQKMLQDLATAEADLNKKIVDKRTAIDNAKKANKTETEIQMMAEQMRLEIEPQARKLEDDTNKRSEEIENNIKLAIDAVAKENKYDVIMIKEAVLFGGTDVSDVVLKKLK